MPRIVKKEKKERKVKVPSPPPTPPPAPNSPLSPKKLEFPSPPSHQLSFPLLLETLFSMEKPRPPSPTRFIPAPLPMHGPNSFKKQECRELCRELELEFGCVLPLPDYPMNLANRKNFDDLAESLHSFYRELQLSHVGEQTPVFDLDGKLSGYIYKNKEK